MNLDHCVICGRRKVHYCSVLTFVVAIHLILHFTGSADSGGSSENNQVTEVLLSMCNSDNS